MVAMSAQGVESPESTAATATAVDTQERYLATTTGNDPTTAREALPPLVCTGEEMR